MKKNNNKNKDIAFTNINDVMNNSFFQLPKFLFYDDYYKNMSCKSKVLYAFLKDRLELSIKNKDDFTDKNGNVYVICTIEEIQDFLNCCGDTATKLKKELKEYNLIFEKRQGLTKPNLIYPLKYVNRKKPSSPVKTLNTKKTVSKDLENPILKTEKTETINTDSSYTYFKQQHSNFKKEPDKKNTENKKTENQNQNQNQKTVVVENSDINNLKKESKKYALAKKLTDKFNKKYNANFNFKTMQLLIYKKTSAIVDKCIEICDEYINKADSIEKLFYSFCVKYNTPYAYTKSTPYANLNSFKPAQALNYEQREYGDEFFDSLYHTF